jgi:hypothetical protein
MQKPPLNVPEPIYQSETKGTQAQQRQTAAPIAGYIMAVAVALLLALPAVAIGLALALNLLCWIAGVCV